MKHFYAADHVEQPADPNTFTGEATLTRMDGVSAQPSINIYRVKFSPRARTAWHKHTGIQLLLILEGECRLQKDGSAIVDLPAGSVVTIEPEERHWHGATTSGSMVHLAVNIDSTTEWYEQVTDAQYLGNRQT